jgi:hypothetical protein
MPSCIWISLPSTGPGMSRKRMGGMKVARIHPVLVAMAMKSMDRDDDV